MAGTTRAVFLFARLARWTMLPLLSACFLPFETDVPVPECVPSLAGTETSPTPLGSVFRVVLASGTGEEEQVFEVDLHDCRAQRTMQYQVVLNYDPHTRPSVLKKGIVTPSQRDRFSFSVPHAEFLRGECNKVTLFVSGEFDFASELEPVADGDLATETWFLEVVRNSTDVADLTRCRQP